MWYPLLTQDLLIRHLCVNAPFVFATEEQRNVFWKIGRKTCHGIQGEAKKLSEDLNRADLSTPEKWFGALKMVLGEIGFLAGKSP